MNRTMAPRQWGNLVAMSFAEVMALRPAEPDSASLQAAIESARAAHARMTLLGRDLEARRHASLLVATDQDLQAAEQAAQDAQRSADRIAALIEAMASDLASTEPPHHHQSAL